MTKKQLIIATIYSSLFPFFSIVNESLANIALFLNAPFLPIGWIGGMALVDIFNTESIYPLGLFMTIFLQTLLIIKTFNLFEKKIQK